MTNEEKILSLLAKVQCDVLELKERVDALEEEPLETLNKMRHLLTKEEADELAAAIKEEARRGK